MSSFFAGTTAFVLTKLYYTRNINYKNISCLRTVGGNKYGVTIKPICRSRHRKKGILYPWPIKRDFHLWMAFSPSSYTKKIRLFSCSLLYARIIITASCILNPACSTKSMCYGDFLLTFNFLQTLWYLSVFLH